MRDVTFYRQSLVCTTVAEFLKQSDNFGNGPIQITMTQYRRCLRLYLKNLARILLFTFKHFQGNSVML